MITSNQLYEANIEIEGDGSRKDGVHSEVLSLFNTYSKAANPSQFQTVRTMQSGGPNNMQDDEAQIQITTDFVETSLNINMAAKEELLKIDTIEFNIFKMQEMTLENELVTTTCFMLAKQQIFQKIAVPFDIFLAFMTKI